MIKETIKCNFVIIVSRAKKIGQGDFFPIHATEKKRERD